MKAVFVDTYFWIALANPRDQDHDRAKELASELKESVLVTTDEVLGEFLTFLGKQGMNGRLAAVRLTKRILDNSNVQVESQTHESFLQGLHLYEQRLDKEYSFVDCVSMWAMQRLGLDEVLTKDHHFEQEGLTILFGES